MLKYISGAACLLVSLTTVNPGNCSTFTTVERTMKFNRHGIVTTLLNEQLHSDSFAARKAKKPKKPKTLLVANLETDGYLSKVGKKEIFCYQDTKSGTIKRLKDGRIQYTSFAEQIKYEKARKGSKLKALQSLEKKAKKLCKKRPETSLAKFKGTFGYDQAARLLRVSTFGAPPAEVNRLVSLGLDRAVDSLIDSHPSEPVLEAEMRDLNCDGYLEGEQQDRVCEDGENDVSREGLRLSMMHYFMNTSSPFTAKLFMFLHDHMAASNRVLDGCELHAAPDHIAMLRTAADNGDLPGLLRQAIEDHLLHYKWLSGRLNAKFSPNEDFGREFLELFTIGKRDLDGNPRYGDPEIISSALAFTGKIIDYYQISPNVYSCYVFESPNLHDDSVKTLWAGKPYQAAVRDGKDMVEAVLRHPGLAEFWALNLWKQYVNGSPSKAAIIESAAVLRKAGYNFRELLRTLLKSQAFYAADSNRTLYKNGIEVLLDIIRTVRIPLRGDRRWLDRIASDLGQQVLNPPTVFGWYTFEDNLSSGRYVMARRNAIVELLNFSSEQSFVSRNYNFFGNLLGDQPSSTGLINRYSQMMGVPLNATQVQALESFMNYDLDGQNREVRDLFDSAPGSRNAVYKTMGLLTALAEQPEFGLK